MKNIKQEIMIALISSILCIAGSCVRRGQRKVIQTFSVGVGSNSNNDDTIQLYIMNMSNTKIQTNDLTLTYLPEPSKLGEFPMDLERIDLKSKEIYYEDEKHRMKKIPIAQKQPIDIALLNSKTEIDKNEVIAVSLSIAVSSSVLSNFNLKKYMPHFNNERKDDNFLLSIMKIAEKLKKITLYNQNLLSQVKQKNMSEKDIENLITSDTSLSNLLSFFPEEKQYCIKNDILNNCYMLKKQIEEKSIYTFIIKMKNSNESHEVKVKI